MLIIPNFNTIGSGAARGGGGAPPFEYTAIANNYSMTFDGTRYLCSRNTKRLAALTTGIFHVSDSDVKVSR